VNKQTSNIKLFRWLQLRFDCGSTAVRLPFHCNWTALRPFDDLRYDCKSICCGLLPHC